MKTDDETENRVENAMIEDAGLYYVGHTRSISLRLELEGRRWHRTLSIPLARTAELMNIFNYSTPISDDIEDGLFISRIKGIPVCVMFDSTEQGCGKITGIGNIMSDENDDDFMIL